MCAWSAYVMVRGAGEVGQVHMYAVWLSGTQHQSYLSNPVYCKKEYGNVLSLVDSCW